MGSRQYRLASAVCAAAVSAVAAGAFAASTGYRPHPNPLRHLTNAAVSASAPAARLLRSSAALPAKYDLRDHDGTGSTFLSPVRNQGSYGTCWTFAALAGIEYQMRRDEGLDADLSENNLANRHGYAVAYSDGGNDLMAAAVFLREEAPVAEALDPYPRVGGSVRERGVRVPRKVVFVPARGSLDDDATFDAALTTVKKAVLAYGPLFTSYAHSAAYLDGAAYYCDNALKSENHAVSIVGWDDSYAASNFKTTPPRDGAFIIRNSWGPGTGDAGYLYISYCDVHLGQSGQTAFTALTDGTDYGRLYQHDPYGYISSYGYGGAFASALNVFTAQADETLTAFGFYALTPETRYTASVILDPSFSSGRLSGNPISVKSGTCADAGYEVLPFDTPVAVAAGRTFAIRVDITTPGYSCPIPVSCNADGYLSAVSPAAGKSFVGYYPDSYGWEDLSSDGAYFCCKVYTQAGSDGFTTTGETSVPFSWLDAYTGQRAADAATGQSYFTRFFYGSYNALAEHVAANGMPVARSYARGLDPDAATATELTATISIGVDGRPVIDAVPRNTALWRYTVLGSTDLKTWHERSEDDRFFKIAVTPAQTASPAD